MTPINEFSMIWGGNTVGDAQNLAPYSEIYFMRYLAAIARMTISGKYGILHTNHASYSGDLAPTNPAGTTLRVASGAAIAWTMIYTNDANVDFSCSNTGYYTVVLRTDLNAQEVRLALLGPSTLGFPQPIRSAGGINDMPIALVYSNGAALTVTDARRFFRNVVAYNHSGESLLWYVPSGTAKRVRGMMMECGNIEPEKLNMVTDSSYQFPRYYPGATAPLVFFQAVGGNTAPDATVLFNTTVDNEQINYCLDSAFYLSGIFWMSIGMYR